MLMETIIAMKNIRTIKIWNNSKSKHIGDREKMKIIKLIIIIIIRVSMTNYGKHLTEKN